MRITACYVVRNEGRNLKKSLDSIKDSVDEIVVVDTGSEDDTKSIAASYGAAIYDFPWQGDFSAARNFALGKIQADWVVAPDGDEYFSLETAGNLRQVIKRGDAEGHDLLLVPWHNIDEETGEVLLDSHAPRIFRCRPELRYEGRIHEELRERGKAIGKVGILSPRELTLVHTGYSARVSKEKAQRNVELLLRELEEGREPGNIFMYLAEAYDGLDDGENALRYARLDAAQGRRNIVYASRSWRILLRRLLEDPAARGERQRVAARAAREFPELPEFHAEYAECLAFLLDFPGAAEEAQAAEKAFEEYGKRPGIEPMMFDGGMLATLRQRREQWRKISARAGEMKVTSCLIVRDGEKDMESWLRNTSRFSDERIVVDTGSEDRTREMACSAGCGVYDLTWANDFSAARNDAIARASGDWISFIDVDEAFEKPEQVKPFLAWLEFHDPAAEAVMVPWLNIDEDDGNREISRNAIVRLFRNHRGLRYEGNVHETLYRSNGELPHIFRERQRLCLFHWGYSSGRIFVKTKRNLALLQEDIGLHGEGPQHYRYLADCYAEMGDWEQAFSYAQKAIASPLQSLANDCRMQHLLLVAMQKLGETYQEQEAVTREMCGAFPHLPDFYGRLGILLAEQGKGEEARSCLKRAMKLAAAANAAGMPTEFADDEGTVCAWLAFLQGGTQEGGEFLKRALQLSPKDDDVLNIARELQQGLSPEEFRQWLKPWLPSSDETEIWLARWAERNGQADLFTSWCERMEGEHGKEMPRKGILEDAWVEEPKEFAEKMTRGMMADVRHLVTMLLELEREQVPHWQVMARQCRELLPEAMEVTWQAYEGKREDFPADGFRALWPMVRAMGDEVQTGRFGSLAMALGGSEWRDVAGELLADEKWEAALSMYGRIAADSPEADGAFWHDVGVCLWHRGETFAAMECFGRARSLGTVTKDMDAYEAWTRGGQSC